MRGPFAVALLAALSLGVSASRRAAATAGLAQARAWLSSHGPQPQQDDLQELKAENPDAYAIVKALLTKRALGLLDPKHPTASFAGPPAQAAAAPAMSSVDFAAQQGVTATSKSEALSQRSASVETAADVEAPAPVHHAHKNWLSWRPADSAADDDAAVAQVLGTVAQLKGGAAASGSLAATDQRVEQHAQRPAAQETNRYLKGIDFGAVAQQVSERPAPAENPYLKGIGLAGTQQVVTQQATQAAPAAPRTAPQPHQNSYLKEIGLAAAKQATQDAGDSHNYLRDFSWSDSDDRSQPATSASAAPAHGQQQPQQQQQQPAQRTAQPEAPVPQVPASSKKGALMAWLGSSWGASRAAPAPLARAVAPAARPTEEPQDHYNSYLRDLQ